jgi:predicted ATP-dependent serine protease
MSALFTCASCASQYLERPDHNGQCRDCQFLTTIHGHTVVRTPEVEPADQRSIARDGDW